VNSCKFKQVTRIKDFSEDGLVFDIPHISFDDIAGHHKAKQRLREVINFFKEPKRLDTFQIAPPKGMLLYGPPGTGKTMLAKAFAREAELPFISITGLELLQPEKTKKVFAKAKEYAPAIIFIDEIDTIGKRGGENNKEVPINKLLSEMDGFSDIKGENIFIIAATNYKENIGSFDMNKLLMYTAGFTGAQLELVGKEASYHCLRHGLPTITQEILIQQINTIKFGEKQSYLSPEQMFAEIAMYEAGRAVVSKMLMPHVQIEHISITPRENHEHFISNNYNDVQDNMTIKDFKDKISVALAGRIAQIKEFGELDGMDTGAANDLQQATRDAYTAIAHYGMDKEVGFVNINGVTDAKLNAPSTKHYHEKIDMALHRWMVEGQIITTSLVEKHWDTIKYLSQQLLEKEIIYDDELNLILAK
jgi:cell division protease FtsH